MKFLVLFSVLAFCALNVNGFLQNHFKKGSSSGASASSNGASGGGGLGGLGNILA